ncbi:MAG: hypothetical protein J1F18_16020, partial [Lachnospiraceae bacterium]|nr:hypothetical protein [Lachnospiraceae bacterium]
TVNEILDYSTFGDWDIDRRAVESYEPAFFSRDNTLKRLYIKAYKVYQLVGNENKSAACLFELIYDIFIILNHRLNLKTSYQLDIKGRENIFAVLKKALKGYGIEISEKFKKDYIISMLDRKVALIEESARFPILEQLGDAIYGFAVAELLFYNPESDGYVNSDFKAYISAYSQVKVAVKLGIDKLYYSSDTCNRKYDYESLLARSEPYPLKTAEWKQAHSEKRKYLADSLEMLIAVLCKDCGYRTAIDFAKRLIRETFPKEFPEEVRWDTAKDRGLREYWARVLPAPYAEFNKFTEMMWDAYMKFMGVYSIGTDDLMKRVALAHFPYSDAFMLSNPNERYIAFYEYLHNGIDYAIKVYSARIAEEFNKR